MEAQGRINGECHTNEGAPQLHTTVNSFFASIPKFCNSGRGSGGGSGGSGGGSLG